MRKWQVLSSTLIACLLLSDIQLNLTKIQSGNWLNINSAALARKSSGGRSRSGSFNRGSSPSRSTSPAGNSQRNRENSRPSQSRPTTPAGNSQPNNRENSRPSQSRPTNSPGGAQGTTGGRTRTGTFERNSSPPPSRPTPTPTDVRPRNTPQPAPVPTPAASPRPNYDSQPPVNRRDTVIVPVPVPVQPRYYPPVQPNYPVQTQTSPVPAPVTQPEERITVASNRNSRSNFWVWLLILGGIAAVIAIAWYLLSQKRDSATTAEQELSNDIVTVSKLQVALLAEARHIQSELRDLSLTADLETAAGRSEFLRESALAVLRSPEYWSHVLATSQTVANLQQAQTLFEQFSIGERSKFSRETFTNDQGQLRRHQNIVSNPDEEPPAYIVVTFLVGTENDQPLFGAIHSADELEQSLKTLASLTPDYLLVFELLWSPEIESDSLTYDELLTEYSNMIQL